jgi:Phosphofructokinase
VVAFLNQLAEPLTRQYPPPLTPATIANDLPEFTERSLGFDTAVSNVVRVAERCRDTADSHHRVLVLETMGRKSGQIAEAARDALAADPPRSGVIGLRYGRFVLQRFGDPPSTALRTSALKDHHLQMVLSKW